MAWRRRGVVVSGMCVCAVGVVGWGAGLCMWWGRVENLVDVVFRATVCSQGGGGGGGGPENGG